MPSPKRRLLSPLSPPQVPVVTLVEGPPIQPGRVPELLREILQPQWAALTEVLSEAKLKAELQLRNDLVFDSPLRLAYYQGWVAYADYALESLARLREGGGAVSEEGGGEPQPGPED